MMIVLAGELLCCGNEDTALPMSGWGTFPQSCSHNTLLPSTALTQLKQLCEKVCEDYKFFGTQYGREVSVQIVVTTLYWTYS